VCSGQSNMEWRLADVTDASRELAAARDPRVRHFKVPTASAESPAADLPGGRWERADAAHVAQFTAVGWFFAEALRRSVDVPIGLINTSWGGSRIEPWISPAGLGLDSAGLARLMAAERETDAAAARAIRERLGGDPPTVDAGMVGARAAWADPALDDRAWATIRVPALWESEGYPGMDGTAWYRTTFELTAAEAARGVRVGLGAIDDSDVAWVNGRRVGGMTSAYSVARVYDVPPAALRAGANVIAVRVDDTGGGGGISGAPSSLFVEVGGVRRPLAAEWRFRVGAVALRADAQRVNKVPTVVHQAMVHPLARYPVAGALWYQGESNANTVEEAAEYRRLLPALVADWRRLWKRPDLPFLVVQLPNFNPPDSAPPARSAWATLREAQAAAADSVPGVATVVTIDLGEAGDIHPRDKRPVGARLALAARRLAYGQAVEASGPTYRAHRVDGGRVVIDLAHADGLAARGGAADGFAVAGADRQFVWADARIEGDRVVVWSDRVPAPVAVRYAWADNPARANLYNRAGLPAAPFRTDRW
jgi:sialate O-acetylesterase